MIMKKTKFLLITSIISIFLMCSLCTICYAYTLDIDVNGVKMQVEYTAPTLDQEDIDEIKQAVDIYVALKEIEEEWTLKEEIFADVVEKVEELIKEKEEEKLRETEKEVLKEMEKQYRAEKNKIPNAGDTTILVLKVITFVSIIALFVVIVSSKTIKK